MLPFSVQLNLHNSNSQGTAPNGSNYRKFELRGVFPNMKIPLFKTQWGAPIQTRISLAYSWHTPGTSISYCCERIAFYLHFQFFLTNLEYHINIQKRPWRQNLFIILSMYLIVGSGVTYFLKTWKSYWIECIHPLDVRQVCENNIFLLAVWYDRFMLR